MRQLLPAMISRRAIAAKITRKAISITAAIHCTPNGGAGNRQAARKPQGEQAGQRIAVDRQPAGPIGNCRKQKTGDGRRDVAVDHLVDVPIQRIESGRQRHFAEILRQPKRNAERGPRGSAQKERTKAVRENRRAGVFKAALQRGGLVHHELLVSHPGHHLTVVDFRIGRAFNTQNADQSALKSRQRVID